MNHKRDYEEKVQVRLKNKLISMFEVPQIMLLKEIRQRNCIHDGDFCYHDNECWRCDLGTECKEIVGKYSRLGPESNLGRILSKILIAQGYVQHKLGGSKHARIGCACESCNWLRELECILPQL